MPRANGCDSSLSRRFSSRTRSRVVLVAVDPRAPEVAQGVLEHPAGAGLERRRVERGELGEDVGVEVQVGGERPRLDLEALGRLHHGGVGVHHAHQGADREHVGQRDAGVVPQLEDRLVAGRCVLERRHLGAGRRPGRCRARSVTQPSQSSSPGRAARAVAGPVGSMLARLAPGHAPRLGPHEHPHRRRARRDRPDRPAARRPAAGAVDRRDLPRGRHLLQRGPRHVRLHRHLAAAQPVSVQGSGMGQPSMSIYVNELFREYDVQRIIRVGSCGAVTERVALRDVVIASGACTDSSMNRLRFHGLDYAPGGRLRPAAGGRRRGRGPRRRHQPRRA